MRSTPPSSFLQALNVWLGVVKASAKGSKASKLKDNAWLSLKPWGKQSLRWSSWKMWKALHWNGFAHEWKHAWRECIDITGISATLVRMDYHKDESDFTLYSNESTQCYRAWKPLPLHGPAQRSEQWHWASTKSVTEHAMDRTILAVHTMLRCTMVGN